METEIVIKALEDAVLTRKLPPNCMFHTDLGFQYTSSEYERKIEELEISHSYSRKGCHYGNAGIESFHLSFKKEQVYKRSTYSTFEEAKTQLFSYVQEFYNNGVPIAQGEFASIRCFFRNFVIILSNKHQFDQFRKRPFMALLDTL